MKGGAGRGGGGRDRGAGGGHGGHGARGGGGRSGLGSNGCSVPIGVPGRTLARTGVPCPRHAREPPRWRLTTEKQPAAGRAPERAAELPTRGGKTLVG